MQRSWQTNCKKEESNTSVTLSPLPPTLFTEPLLLFCIRNDTFSLGGTPSREIYLEIIVIKYISEIIILMVRF